MVASLTGFGSATPVAPHALGPVRRAVPYLRRDDVLARHAVQREEVAVARRGGHQLARPAVDRRRRRARASAPSPSRACRAATSGSTTSSCPCRRRGRPANRCTGCRPCVRRRCTPASDCRCRRCRAWFRDRRRRESRPARRRGARHRGWARCRDRDRPASSAPCRRSSSACRSRDRTTAGTRARPCRCRSRRAGDCPPRSAPAVEKYCCSKDAISTCQRS